MMGRGVVWGWLIAIAAATSAPLAAQTECTSDGVVSGRVTTVDGSPVFGADVFILATLDGATTDERGCFQIASAFTGSTVLVVRGLGYETQRVEVAVPATGIAVSLVAEAIVLEPLTVRAGATVVTPEEDAALTSLDVVTTPGTAADVLRAVQTLAGVQTVGDGAGLVVRGGDVAETKVILDGARVLAPYRYESPTGSAFGAFDPFALDGITFSSGGFGARHGDALSGVVELNSLGVPEASGLDLTASLAAVSGRAVLATRNAGLRITGTRSHTGLLFDLNGVDTDFTRVPEGSDLSVAGAWRYRPTGEIKVLSILQDDQFGVEVADPSFIGAFESDNRTRTTVLSGSDFFGRFRPSWSLSYSTRERGQSFGAFRLNEDDRFLQARAEVVADVSPRVLSRFGLETESRAGGIAGSFPTDADVRPESGGTGFESEVTARRHAGFAEVEWRPWDQLAVVPGVRFDRGSLPQSTTVDPRLSLAYRLGEGLTATGAWGVYHQVPVPLAYEPTVGIVDLPSMRAQHWIGGLSYEDGQTVFRAEVYRKRYTDLAAPDRDAQVRGGGRGLTKGVDVFVRGDLGWGVGGRVSYSYLTATRTDPNTGLVAPSPFDVSHSWVVVLDRGLGPAWSISASLRHATGRPFTPVMRADFDPDQQVWLPEYGASGSERYPAFRRVDASLSRLHSFWAGNVTVFFLSLTNVFDRANVTGYQYSSDYSDRSPVDSAFRRTIYVGATVTTPF